jgi:hypothetical protein
VLGLIFDFLTCLIFPPRFQTGHFQHSAGVPCIEFQIHAAVKRRNRTVVVDSFLNNPRVSCLERAWLEHTQIKTCAIFANRQLDPVGASDPTGLIRTRNPWAAHLNHRSTQPDRIAYADLIFGYTIQGDVFADTSCLNIHVVSGIPEGIMIGQMDADCCAWTSMIGLCNLVTGKPVKRDLHRAIRTIAKDRRGPCPALISDRFGLSGEDCLNYGRFRHAIDFRLALEIRRLRNFADIAGALDSGSR